MGMRLPRSKHHVRHHAVFCSSCPLILSCLLRYRTLGRTAEARDAMTAALSMPMWTLGDVNVLDAAKVIQARAVLPFAPPLMPWPLRPAAHAVAIPCRLRA
jgi:hypothetical protein